MQFRKELTARSVSQSGEQTPRRRAHRDVQASLHLNVESLGGCCKGQTSVRSSPEFSSKQHLNQLIKAFSLGGFGNVAVLSAERFSGLQVKATFTVAVARCASSSCAG